MLSLSASQSSRNHLKTTIACFRSRVLPVTSSSSSASASNRQSFIPSDEDSLQRSNCLRFDWNGSASISEPSLRKSRNRGMRRLVEQVIDFFQSGVSLQQFEIWDYKTFAPSRWSAREQRSVSNELHFTKFCFEVGFRACPSLRDKTVTLASVPKNESVLTRYPPGLLIIKSWKLYENWLGEKQQKSSFHEQSGEGVRGSEIRRGCAHKLLHTGDEAQLTAKNAHWFLTIELCSSQNLHHMGTPEVLPHLPGILLRVESFFHTFQWEFFALKLRPQSLRTPRRIWCQSIILWALSNINQEIPGEILDILKTGRLWLVTEKFGCKLARCIANSKCWYVP